MKRKQIKLLKAKTGKDVGYYSNPYHTTKDLRELKEDMQFIGKNKNWDHPSNLEVAHIDHELQRRK